MDFGSGIVESARIVHFAEVDERRRKTLLALIELATENSPGACFDDRRAAGILRRETTATELRELGADEQMIEFVFTASQENDDR
jgi:alkylhydroperoxidase family enzyme